MLQLCNILVYLSHNILNSEQSKNVHLYLSQLEGFNTLKWLLFFSETIAHSVSTHYGGILINSF